MKAKDEWINDAFKSIDEIKRAELSSEISERILKSRLTSGKIIQMNPLIKWAAAASIVLLIGLNIFSIIHCRKSSLTNNEKANPVYNEYFSYLNSL